MPQYNKLLPCAFRQPSAAVPQKHRQLFVATRNLHGSAPTAVLKQKLACNSNTVLRMSENQHVKKHGAFYGTFSTHRHLCNGTGCEGKGFCRAHPGSLSGRHRQEASTQNLFFVLSLLLLSSDWCVSGRLRLFCVTRRSAEKDLKLCGVFILRFGRFDRCSTEVAAKLSVVSVFKLRLDKLSFVDVFHSLHMWLSGCTNYSWRGNDGSYLTCLCFELHLAVTII